MVTDRRGSMLIEGIIGVVIVGLTALALISHINNERKSISQASLKVSVVTATNNLRKALLDDQAWAQTVNDLSNTASFACTKCGVANCNRNEIHPFVPVDASGAPLVVQLNVSGSVCDPLIENCPYSAGTTWTPICDPGDPCKPTQVEINIQWAQANNIEGNAIGVSLPENQKIIKNLPDPPGGFFLASLVNTQVKRHDCNCGTQRVGKEMSVDHPQPGQYVSMELCQPRGFSPPGQAAYTVATCGDRNDVVPCNLACDNGDTLIQTVAYNIPAQGNKAGFPVKFGICENTKKSANVHKILALAIDSNCAPGWTEESSNPIDVGSVTVPFKLCSQPR
jgi:hypothetical protein